MERRYDKGFAIIFIVLGVIMTIRSIWMFMHDKAWMSINLRFLQPVFHTPIYDALLSMLLLFVGVRLWVQHRRKWGGSNRE